MADGEAKQALLSALGTFLQGDRHMGEMEEILPVLEAYLQLYSRSDFVCAMVPNAPARVAEYPGVNGLAEAWSDWGETFESVRADAEELREAENAVVLFVTQFAVTKTGGVEMTQPSAMLWLFEDDLVRRLEFHLDREATLTAGGMTP